MVPAIASHPALVKFPSDLGWFGVVLDSKGIRQLHFGDKSRSDVHEKVSASGDLFSNSLPSWWEKAQNLLIAFAAGEAVDLTHIPLSSAPRTPFQTRVVQALLQVGYGQTITYTELAKRAGSAGAARAVGNQMSKNCVPLIIPCHRVIGSGGRLGGFSAADGLDMKRRLLLLENAQSHFSMERVVPT